MSTRRIIQESGDNGVDRILQEDGVSFILLEGDATANDDVLIRLGPGLAAGTGSGLITSTFSAITPAGGGGAVGPGYFYTMTQEWFNSA